MRGVRGRAGRGTGRAVASRPCRPSARGPLSTSSGSCGTRATRSWSAWTRSAGRRGPGRSRVGAAVLPPRPAGLQGPGLEDAHRAPSARPCSTAIAEWCVAWAVGHASQVECDELGMSAAQQLAARRAIDGLGVVPDQVLIDGNWDFVGGGNDPHASSRATPPACRSRRRRSWPRSPATASCGPRPSTSPATTSSCNKGYPCPRHKVALRAWARPRSTAARWVFMDDLPWPRAAAARPRRDPRPAALFADAIAAWPASDRPTSVLATDMRADARSRPQKSEIDGGTGRVSSGEVPERGLRVDAGVLRQAEHPLADDVAA